MKKIILSSILLVGVLAQANTKFELGGGVWNSEVKGNISYQGTYNDLKNDFGLSDKNLPYFYTDLQHSIPVIPNLRLEYTDLSYKGATNKTISFGSQTFNLGEVDSEINLKSLDAILYYNLIDKGGLNADLGLDFKYLDGDTSVSNSGITEKANIEVVIPHLYANVRYDFSCGAGIELEGKYLEYDGAKSYDYMAKIDYKVFKGLALEGGYKEVGVKIPQSFADDYNVDTTLDFKFSGPYAGLNYKF